jgi:hypothetical protein
MGRNSRIRRQAKVRSRRHRHGDAAGRREPVVRLDVVITSTLADPDELNDPKVLFDPGEHRDCGCYGLRLTIAMNPEIVLRADAVLPGCLSIRDAEDDALAELHAEGVGDGTFPARCTFNVRRPFHGLTDAGERLLRRAPADSAVAQRLIELDEGPLRRVDFEPVRRRRSLGRTLRDAA